MLKKIDDVLRFLRKRRGVFQNIYPLCGRLGRNPIPVTVWYMGVTDLPLLQCVPSNALVSGRQRPEAAICGELLSSPVGDTSCTLAGSVLDLYWSSDREA